MSQSFSFGILTKSQFTEGVDTPEKLYPAIKSNRKNTLSGVGDLFYSPPMEYGVDIFVEFDDEIVQSLLFRKHSLDDITDYIGVLVGDRTIKGFILAESLEFNQDKFTLSLIMIDFKYLFSRYNREYNYIKANTYNDLLTFLAKEANKEVFPVFCSDLKSSDPLSSYPIDLSIEDSATQLEDIVVYSLECDDPLGFNWNYDIDFVKPETFRGFYLKEHVFYAVSIAYGCLDHEQGGLVWRKQKIKIRGIRGIKNVAGKSLDQYKSVIFDYQNNSNNIYSIDDFKKGAISKVLTFFDLETGLSYNQFKEKFASIGHGESKTFFVDSEAGDDSYTVTHLDPKLNISFTGNDQFYLFNFEYPVRAREIFNTLSLLNNFKVVVASNNEPQLHSFDDDCIISPSYKKFIPSDVSVSTINLLGSNAQAVYEEYLIKRYDYYFSEIDTVFTATIHSDTVLRINDRFLYREREFEIFEIEKLTETKSKISAYSFGKYSFENLAVVFSDLDLTFSWYQDLGANITIKLYKEKGLQLHAKTIAGDFRKGNNSVLFALSEGETPLYVDIYYTEFPQFTARYSFSSTSQELFSNLHGFANMGGSVVCEWIQGYPAQVKIVVEGKDDYGNITTRVASGSFNTGGCWQTFIINEFFHSATKFTLISILNPEIREEFVFV